MASLTSEFSPKKIPYPVAQVKRKAPIARAVDAENLDPNLPAVVEKIKKKLPLQQTAPRTSLRCISNRIDAFTKTKDRVQSLARKLDPEVKTKKMKANVSAELEESKRHQEHIAKGMRTLFQLSLEFRLDAHEAADAAEFWLKRNSHYRSPTQHIENARTLLRHFYEKAPELKEDLTSRGAIEFLAYAVAAKAGEDTEDLCLKDFITILSDQDNQALTAAKLKQLEIIFLMTIDYQHLNFDHDHVPPSPSSLQKDTDKQQEGPEKADDSIAQCPVTTPPQNIADSETEHAVASHASFYPWSTEFIESFSLPLEPLCLDRNG